MQGDTSDGSHKLEMCNTATIAPTEFGERVYNDVKYFKEYYENT